MRTARVFYLLLSVLQFIFFLKLVEYVRGEEIPRAGSSQISSTTSDSVTTNNEQGRLFIAPKIKRKWVRDGPGKSTNSSAAGTEYPNIRADVNVTNSNNTQTRREHYEKEVARLCPACEGACNPSKPITGGFPIIPVIIAVIVGVAWFILFLIAWIFHTRPNTKGQQSGGYEGGYSEGGYGVPQPAYGADTSKSSIFDHFMKPHERRSFNSYTTMLMNVLDSIGKLSDLYNDS